MIATITIVSEIKLNTKTGEVLSIMASDDYHKRTKWAETAMDDAVCDGNASEWIEDIHERRNGEAAWDDARFHEGNER